MKKIMFNDKYGLTQAVLEGRKTQTRRMVGSGQIYDSDTNSMFHGELSEAYKDMLTQRFSNYKVGEVVAVAQSYHDAKKEVGGLKSLLEGHPLPSAKGINNKMYVKADLMPHRIKITNVRVERLQDISEEDCLKEGIEKIKILDIEAYVDAYVFNGCRSNYWTPREAFADLIDKTCGKGTWDSNPWVFVYDFELVK